MQLPQVNATLIEVRSRERSENYTDSGGTKAKWKGEADAYVMRKERSNLNERGELNRMEVVTILIPSDTTPPVGAVQGDEIIFTQASPTSDEPDRFAARAETIVTPSNLPGVPQYMRIGLEDVLAQS